ncbi:MAG: hypothetical protein V4813_01520 [Gemmatimonadota bacterium]
MTSPATHVATRLSALRLVSFVPPQRDAVHVGLLTPDAQHVIDLAGLGITDALEALDQLPMLRQAAGAIVHGAARTAFPVSGLHLVAPIPLVRSVVSAPGQSAPAFADPATLHGPGGHLSRDEAAAAQVGMAAVVGTTLDARVHVDDETVHDALVGTVLVLGWPQPGHDGQPALRAGAVGPFVAVPRRRPDALILTHVAPLAPGAPDDHKRTVPAPTDAEFVALARRALASHVLRPGDLLTIFPTVTGPAVPWPVTGGSWVRASAPGLGSLSLAVL